MVQLLVQELRIFSWVQACVIYYLQKYVYRDLTREGMWEWNQPHTYNSEMAYTRLYTVAIFQV